MSPQLAELIQQAEGLSSTEQLQLIAHLAQRLSAVSPEIAAEMALADQEEAALLGLIHQGIPTEVQSRYDQLSAKLRAEEISPEEHQELLELTHGVEKADGERLKALVTLAKRRNVSLPQLMQDLNLKSLPHAVDTVPQQQQELDVDRSAQVSKLKKSGSVWIVRASSPPAKINWDDCILDAREERIDPFLRW